MINKLALVRKKTESDAACDLQSVLSIFLPSFLLMRITFVFFIFILIPYSLRLA